MFGLCNQQECLLATQLHVPSSHAAQVLLTHVEVAAPVGDLRSKAWVARLSEALAAPSSTNLISTIPTPKRLSHAQQC